MKGLLVKEIKLLSKYAILAFVGLTIYSVYSNYVDLSLMRPDQLYLSGPWAPPLGPLVIWAVPIVAFSFGFWQFFSEQIPGKPSIRTQRRVSLSQMFWSKALVGLSLIALISVAPFVVQEAYQIYANHFQVPAFVDFSTVQYYLALAHVAWMSGALVAVTPGKSWGRHIFSIAFIVTILSVAHVLEFLAVAVLQTLAA